MPMTVSLTWTYYLIKHVPETPYALKLKRNEPKFEIGADDMQGTCKNVLNALYKFRMVCLITVED
jgi:hypothetical protein